MNLISNRLQSAPPAHFMLLVAPWLLQGVILICVMHGHPPFFADNSNATDAYGSGSGPISGTALYLARIAIWIGTFVVLRPLAKTTRAMKQGRLLMFSLPLLAITSMAWSTAPKYTLGGSVDLLLLTVAGLYIGTAFRPEQQMQIFMLTGALAAVSSLLIAGLAPKEGLDPFGHIGALKGIFTHKNSCGFSMALLTTPALFIRRSMRIGRTLVWAYGALCVSLVFLSQSRTAWIDLLCLCLGSLILAALRNFRPKDSYVVGLAITLAVSAAVYLLFTNGAAILAAIGKDPTFSGRELVWQAVFEAITKKPLLGYGYQAFFSSLSAGAGSLVMSTHFVVNHPHNGYLSIWLNLGLVGLVLFSLIVFRAFRDEVKSWRQRPYTDWYICIILVTLVENISEVSLLSADDLSWLLFVVACTGLHQAASEERTPAFPAVPAFTALRGAS